ncbi:MAG: hypothetical protein OEZ43_09675 [Gammaproteobacteria bacterium]|nr:hypothetical protein [Gammaproteobacteria bacterium]
MTVENVFYLWSNNAGVSVVIWFVLIVLAMYLGRTPAHQLLSSMGRSVRAAARLSARSLSRFEQRLTERNKEVVLAAGLNNVEKQIEREFHRVNAVVSRDLSGYPALHRKISDALSKIEEDYRSATETPPSPPAWLDAVDTIARIPRHGDPTVAKILDGLHETIETAHKETIDSYRKNSLQRHQLLKRMLPSWRTVSQTLNEVNNRFNDLESRSNKIDNQIKTYEAIRAAEDHAARSLTSSSLTQFFIAGFVLLIALFGAVINFQLIALPMSEMVGGTSQLGPMKTADVAALVIIMVEMAMGLFLLESLRITHLFPVIHSMDDHMRRKMLIITLTILTILATVEASLAYMRDLLAMDREALAQSLSGLGVVDAEFRWIPSMGQMIMGFILPFTLAFVAIPLESFIHSLRTVLGLMGLGVLRTLSFMIRFCGNLFNNLTKVCVGLYDVLIFLPLHIEKVVINHRKHVVQDDVEKLPKGENIHFLEAAEIDQVK